MIINVFKVFSILRVINELIIQKGKDKNELRQLSSLLFIAIYLKEIHDFCLSLLVMTLLKDLIGFRTVRMV